MTPLYHWYEINFAEVFNAQLNPESGFNQNTHYINFSIGCGCWNGTWPWHGSSNSNSELWFDAHGLLIGCSDQEFSTDGECIWTLVPSDEVDYWS